MSKLERLIEIKNHFRKVIDQRPSRADPLAAAAWVLITFVEEELERPAQAAEPTRRFVARAPREPTMRFVAERNASASRR